MAVDIGLLPEQKLLVGAGVTEETFGDRTPLFDREGNIDPKKEKDKVRFWLDRVQIAKMKRDQVHQDLGVERFLKEYQGEYEVTLGRMRVPPIGEVYAYVQSLIALLINRNPHIAVNANVRGSIQGAIIFEELVNYFFRELDNKEEISDELIDVALAGSGWHKVGVVAKTEGRGDVLKDMRDILYSMRVSFRDMVWNIGARKAPDDCVWMAQRIVRPTSQVKEKYGTRAIGLKGGPHPDLTKDQVNASVFKDDLNYSTLWEIWDREHKETFLIAEDHEKYLRVPRPWPKYLDEYPFQHLWFNRIPDKSFPLPDIQPFEPQILEKIKLVAMALNHVKRWNRQALIKRGAMRRAEMDKFERGGDGTIIEIDAASPADAVKALEYPPLQGDVYAILSRLDEIINSTSGQPSAMQGGTDRAPTRTLGQLQLQQQGGQNRVAFKQDRVERHIEKIARQLIAHIKRNMPLEAMLKITGMPPRKIVEAFGQKFDPKTKTLKFTNDDIQGEYDVSVKAGSTLPLNREGRLAVLQQVLVQSARLAQMESLPPFIQVVIEEILRDFDIESLKAAFEAQTQQAQQKAQQKAQQEGVDTSKTAAEADKRKAQAEQIRAETRMDGAEMLLNASKEGVLPEAVEFGRGQGLLPSDEDFQQ